MKLPLSWLQDFIKIKSTPEKIAEALTLSGSEVETIHRRNPDELKSFDKVVVGQILEISKHPNADKLRLTKVTIGKQIFSIVCGATNIEVGQKVPVALVGASLPNGMKIEKAKIRGVESEGMLCSAKELGFSDDHAGIYPHTKREFKDVDQKNGDHSRFGVGVYILGDDVKIGISLVKALALNETVLDLDITPNRGDCLSVRGLAREVSAVMTKSVLPHPDFLLELPPIDLETESEKSRFDLNIRIEDTKDCPKYSARVVYDVEVGESPQWLKNRLLSVGVRPTNNIVDVTNYVMMELGQPLHAFDLDKISGTQNEKLKMKSEKLIVVRRAKSNEKIVALDDKTYDLTPDMLVIADSEKPIAIAGVMGGRDTAVSTATTSIILEAAQFHPELIRQSSKMLGLKSDSSYRFERGVDGFRVEQALGRAVELIEEVAGGSRDKRLIAVGKAFRPRTINTTPQFISSLLGKNISQKEIKTILSSLGFSAISASTSAISAQTPSWRNDIQIPEDIVEEVGRMVGYGNIEPKELAGSAEKEHRDLDRIRKIREVLLGVGFHETLSYSFYGKQYAQLVNDAFFESHFRVENPMNPDQEYLRKSLLPRLWEAAEKNSREAQDVQLFEMGRVFLPNKKGDLPQEEKLLSFVSVRPEIGTIENFRVIKKTLEMILRQLGIDPQRIRWHRESSFMKTELFVDGREVGMCGIVDRKVRKVFKIHSSSMFVEVRLSALLSLPMSSRRYQPINEFPVSRRDLSLIVDQSKTYQEVIDAMKGLSSFLVDIELFDYFDDEKKLGKGKKSMAFHLTFQSPERTLTSEGVEDALAHIVHHLEASLGAQVRK